MKEAESEFGLIRKASGLTQVETAALLGVTQATVSRWETGKMRPDARTMIALRTLIAARAAA